jgi:hypothetical protein
MTPDYRAEKMSTLEGQGRAALLWETFLDDELEGIAEDAMAKGPLPPAKDRLEDLDEDIRFDIAEWAHQRAELMGFWLAWHLAGGFRQLELGGWHRATIFRKIRQFRDEFGAHPDEATFDWITLDLRKIWRVEVANNVTAGRHG